MSDHLTPAHPAALTLHDEDGRAIHLHPSERAARLECLKLVAAHVQRVAGEPLIPAEIVVAKAEILAAFVLGAAPAEEAVSHPAWPSMVFDGSPESAKSIGAWVRAEGRGLVLNPGDRVEMDPHGSFWRVQTTISDNGSVSTTRGALPLMPAPAMEVLMAAQAQAKPPERPALSEETRTHLRERIATLTRSVTIHAEDLDRAERDVASRARRLTQEREEIAALQRDLGEPSAP